MTKKILLGLACALVVAPLAMAGSAAPRALRTWGDQGNDGSIFSIGSAALVGHPDCDAAGLTTINGAGYAGAIGTFDLIGGDPSIEDDYIHDMSTIAVFSADDFLEGGNVAAGDFSLDLGQADNFGITYQLSAGTVSDGLLREVLMALGAPRGPFGAGFSRPTNLMTETRDNFGSYLGGTTITFAPAIQDATIALGGNGGTLNACLGPTGQVRIIDPDNNNYDEDCGNWRATTIEVGQAGLRTEIEAALERETITTCDVSCAGGAANVDCDNEIPHPFAISITAGNVDVGRWQQWMVLEGFLFGFIDNIVVLGGDPTEPSTIGISW